MVFESSLFELFFKAADSLFPFVLGLVLLIPKVSKTRIVFFPLDSDENLD